MHLDHLDREERIELLGLLEERARRVEVNKLAHYQPYKKQEEFHANGAIHRERLLIAGNQLGKTFGAGCECAMHATGNYPDWWTGHRFPRANVGWAGSVTMEVSRDASQRILLGRYGERGAGAIPGYLLESLATHPSIAGAVSVARIRHVTGGLSTVIFKSYDQGRKKWQGDSVDWVWFDEEPPEDIYSEGLTRTNATRGIALMTFTPLMGRTPVVKRFLSDPSPDRSVTRMTIYDAEHYTDDDRKRIIDSYPEHEREARVQGLPMQGQGMVFPLARSVFECKPFEIPEHWPRVCALDFGWEHPTACVWLAWDKEGDVLYAYDCYGASKQIPVIHAVAIKARGSWIPCMWPHDGLQHDKGSGEQLAKQYKDAGVAMWHERVTFEDGTNGVEAGISEMLTRMQTGRLKIFSHLADLWEEINGYHRKDGLIVKEGDDRISALRYAVMGKRYACTEQVEDITDYVFPVDY
jgi:phage terminase large subunit-like protein